ncbi:MAG TPA: FtsX-like permease family protein [Phycisphaerae bacterium]|nr:FtsX-like permease family protein [Phycisphaerae bacterium]
MTLRILYLSRNLTRNPRRTLLTCAAVALPITVYVLAMAVVDGVNRFLENSGKQLRIAITQKTSIINPLPEGHRRKIEALDPTGQRIVAVCGLRWIGGQRENAPTPLSSIAVDPDTFVKCFPEHRLTEKEIEAWHKDRQAIMLGRATAGEMGWKVGDRISILPSVPPYRPLEFHVVSTLPDAEDYVTNWFRRDYFEEEIKKEEDLPLGQVSFFFVKCASKEDLDFYRGEIDRHFSGSRDETKSQDEKTFMNEFITQQFDLPKNLTLLSILTVFVAVTAAANTMSMNFRDRINEVATLKALGFSGGFSFALIQAESLLLCALGGLIGALGPYIAFTYTPLKNWTVPLIQTLVVNLNVCGQALLIALAIGVIAAAWPSWSAARMKVVSALRNLE